MEVEPTWSLIYRIRASQCEGSDHGIKPFAFGGDHLVSAGHGADVGFERTETRVGVLSSGRDNRLFANDSFANYLFQATVSIMNLPVAREQLNCLLTFVNDRDLVAEKKVAV